MRAEHPVADASAAVGLGPPAEAALGAQGWGVRLPHVRAEAGQAWLAALFIALVNVAARAPGLGQRSLWLDEAVAVHTAQLGLGGIVLASRQDTTPPLYYLVLGGFERLLGVSEAAVRWPSVLVSAGAAAALFLLARRRLGSFAAWLASALFILSDVNYRFGREARPYALTSLLCIISFAVFFRAVERPSPRRWAVLALTNALMLFTHYAAVFAVAAQGLALLWPWRGWANARRFAMSHAPVAVVLVAWAAGIVAAGQHHKMGWLPAPTLGQVFNVLSWYAGGYHGGWRLVLFAIGAAAALLYARRAGRGVPWGTVPTLVVWGLAPVLLAFAASPLVRCLHARYALYASSGLILLWATAVQALPAGRLRGLAAIAACAMAALGLKGGGRRYAADWRAASEWARAGAASGACRLVLMPSWEAMSLAYYYDPAAFRDPEQTLVRLAADGTCSLNAPQELARLDLADTPEVSLVIGASMDADAASRELARRGLEVIERRSFADIAAIRFARPRPGAR